MAVVVAGVCVSSAVAPSAAVSLAAAAFTEEPFAAGPFDATARVARTLPPVLLLAVTTGAAVGANFDVRVVLSLVVLRVAIAGAEEDPDADAAAALVLDDFSVEGVSMPALLAEADEEEGQMQMRPPPRRVRTHSAKRCSLSSCFRSWKRC